MARRGGRGQAHFDPTLGYPGEGPPEWRTRPRLQGRALEHGAVSVLSGRDRVGIRMYNPEIKKFVNVTDDDGETEIAEILEGKHDDLPEQAFYMVGTIEEAVEKAEQMQSEE